MMAPATSNSDAAHGVLAIVLAATLLLVSSARAAPDLPSYDGQGHNAVFPNHGVAGKPFSREAVKTAVNYGPALITGAAGALLPSPRSISLALAPTPYNKQRSKTRSSEMLTYLGQYYAHEMTRRENDPTSSAPIQMNQPDPFYSDYVNGIPEVDTNTNSTVLPQRQFFRSKATVGPAGLREPINVYTGFIDGSAVYGSDAATNKLLRVGTKGLLRESPQGLPFNKGLIDQTKVLLDMKNDARRVPNTQLRACGESNINQNPGLLALATVFLKEHNRRANLLAIAHPDWNDAEIFDMARMWVIAHLQAVAFKEYFPKLLGAELEPYTEHNTSINPGMDVFFTTVAYRYGHAAVTDVLLRLDENWQEHPMGHLMLLDAYYDPDTALAAGPEALLRGLISKAQGEVEARWSRSIQQNLFGSSHGNGSDLVAINIQRGRDHGIPDYNTCRRALGLAAKTKFSDVTSDAAVAAALSKAYGGDISICDAYVCGLAEDHYNNAHVSELFHASMVEQITRLRNGDYWYFENPQHTLNGIFTLAEVQELKDTKLSAIIARNFNITGIPDDIFVVSENAQCGATEAGAASDQADVYTLAGGRMRAQWTKDATNGPEYLRVTITAPGQGWVGFGVPQPGTTPGSMMPGADVVIGRIVNGKPSIDDYSIPTDVHTTPVLDTDNGGTNDVKAISLTYDSGTNQMTMVLERPYAARDARDVAISRSGPVSFIVAYGDSAELIYHGDLKRAYLTLPGGLFTSRGIAVSGVVNTDSKAYKDRQAHGILMAINFVLVLPMGAVLARQLRNRWITALAVQATLFYVHIITQVTGIALATAGFILAFNNFNVPLNDVPMSHGKLGIAVLALLYSQLVMGFVRPSARGDVTPQRRRLWEISHALLGRSAMMLGLTNVFLGIYIFSTRFSADVAVWGGLCAFGVIFTALVQYILDRKDKHTTDAILLKHGIGVDGEAVDSEFSDDKAGLPVTVLASNSQQ